MKPTLTMLETKATVRELIGVACAAAEHGDASIAFAELTIDLLEFRAEFVSLPEKTVSLGQIGFLIGEEASGFGELAGL